MVSAVMAAIRNKTRVIETVAVTDSAPEKPVLKTLGVDVLALVLGLAVVLLSVPPPVVVVGGGLVTVGTSPLSLAQHDSG